MISTGILTECTLYIWTTLHTVNFMIQFVGRLWIWTEFVSILLKEQDTNRIVLDLIAEIYWMIQYQV